MITYYAMYFTFIAPCIVNVFLSMTTRMQSCIILFIIVNALHVSIGFSAHHQELKSVHAASGICQNCLLLPLAWMRWDSSTLAVTGNKFDKYLMLHVQI